MSYFDRHRVWLCLKAKAQLQMDYRMLMNMKREVVRSEEKGSLFRSLNVVSA